MNKILRWIDNPEISKDINRIEGIFRRNLKLNQVKLEGVYEAKVLGPKWLQVIAKISLPFAGLSGWYGKRLESGRAVNLVYKSKNLIDSVEMKREIGRSWVDGQACLVLSYDKSAPALLRPMRDEFRQLDDDTLLGLSIYDIPGIRKVPLPFLLQRTS